jgi:hypothetical protein
MDLDAFLGHTAGAGSRGNFLKNWRKKEPPKLTVWLHLAVGMGHARWSHNWPRIMIREDRDTGEAKREVWGGTWVCHESELVLRKQRFREADGSREVPPVICPLCKTIEVIHEMVLDGRLEWTQPVFRFKGTESEHDVTIRAAGIYNGFKSKDLTKEDKAELRSLKIYPSEAWRENAMTRCQYTFAIVDEDHPEEGVQITDEAEALGNAMKRVLKDKIEEIGREAGNPLRTPYPFMWEYRPDEQFEKKYRVVPKTMVECSEEVDALIRSDAPNLDSHLEPGNIATLRSEMESACLIDDFPFDEIFEAAEKLEAEKKKAAKKAAADDAEDAGNDDTEPPEGGDDAPADDDGTDFEPAKLEADESEAEGDDGELYECDVCDFDELKADDLQCPKCGAVYNDDGDVVSRPCAKCKEQVETSTDARVICGACGTIHLSGSWEVVEPEKKKTTKRKATKRKPAKGKATKGHAKDHVDPTDDLPWGKNK